MIAAILLRSLINVKKDIKATLKLLKLDKRNKCVLLDNRKEILGMLKKVKDYITYGEIDNETLKLLIEKRGKEYKEIKKKDIKPKRFIEFNGKKYYPYFNLHPPRKGLERKGIKKSFKEGGALGYRGEKINELIRRMI